MQTTIHQIAPALRGQVRSTMWLCTGFGVFVMLVAVFQPPETPSAWRNFGVISAIAAAGALVMYAIDRLWFAPYVQVSPAGVKQVFPSGKTIEISWSDITEVRNSSVMQRLVVRSSTGTSMNVEHQLEAFESVKQVLERLAVNARWL